MRKLRIREVNWLALGHTAGRGRGRIQTDSGPKVCVLIPWSLLPPRPSPLIHHKIRPSFLLSQVILRGTDSQEGHREVGVLRHHCPSSVPPRLPTCEFHRHCRLNRLKWNPASSMPQPPILCFLTPIYSSFSTPIRVKPCTWTTAVYPEPSPFSIPVAPGQAWAYQQGLCLHTHPAPSTPHQRELWRFFCSCLHSFKHLPWLLTFYTTLLAPVFNVFAPAVTWGKAPILFLGVQIFPIL